MQLYYSPNSPFARIARVALRETGLIDSTEEFLAKNRAPDNPVLEHSPVGRVPTLVADGLTITETRPIYDFILQKAGTPPGPEPWERIALDGQVFGFMEGISAWIREIRRGDLCSEFLRQVEIDRATRCLDHLNGLAAKDQVPPFPSFSAVALAVSLDLMMAFHLRPGWQSDHPGLSAWHRTVVHRPSMAETRPIGD